MKKFDKKKAQENYNFNVLAAKTFLNGQLELYKIKFVDTGDNNFIETMNDMHSTFKLICNMDYEIRRLSKECYKLNKENKERKV